MRTRPSIHSRRVVSSVALVTVLASCQSGSDVSVRADGSGDPAAGTETPNEPGGTSGGGPGSAPTTMTPPAESGTATAGPGTSAGPVDPPPPASDPQAFDPNAPLPDLPPGQGVNRGGLRPTPVPKHPAGYDDLLAAWRTLDHEGMACANCHSPDAFDLAFFAYDDLTISRRALNHVDKDTADKIVQFINLTREMHGITEPKDPMTFRAFQPGPDQKVLPGNTPAERDYALAKHLKTRLPQFFNGPIDTVEEALAAKKALLEYHPRREPVGVEFPRWTEDGFHGDEHGTVNDWIPERPQIGSTPEARAQLWALHDAYIASTAPDDLWAISESYGNVVEAGRFSTDTGPVTDGAKGWSVVKQRDVLFGQHLLRQQHYKVSDDAPRIGWSVMMKPNYQPINPFFDLGDFGNHSVIGPTDIPTHFRKGLTAGRDTPEGFGTMMSKEVLLEWWVMGWTFSPKMDSVANWQEYFPQSIGGGRSSGQALAVHQALISWIMAMHQNYTEPMGSPNRPGGGVLMIHQYSPGITFRGQYGNEYFNAEHLELSKQFMHNLVRMGWMLQVDETAKQCAAGEYKYHVLHGDPRLEKWTRQRWLIEAKTVDPENAALDLQLADAGLIAQETAVNGCVAPVASNGTGLSVSIYSDATLSQKAAVPVDPPLGVGYWSSFCGTPGGDPLVTYVATGKFAPRFTGDHQFGDFDNQPADIWVNGQKVTLKSGARNKIMLEAGKQYDFRAEIDATSCVGNYNWIEIQTSINGGPLKTVPLSSFFPG